MVIQTFEKGYTVISFAESDSVRDVFVCKDDNTGQECSVVRIKDDSIIAGVMEFLYEQVNNKDFSDFLECFVSENKLHIVFKHYAGNSLEYKIEKENNSLVERLQLMKGILEKMVLLNMPEYFQTLCLKNDNIIVSSSLDISFNYQVEDIVKYRQYSMADVMDAVKNIMQYIFDDELVNKKVDSLTVYVDLLNEHIFTSYMEMFKAFNETLKIIEETPDDELEKPKNWFFVLWEKVVKLFKPLKRILAVVLLIVAFGYMIYVISDALKPSGEQKIFDYIGTVNIEK